MEAASKDFGSWHVGKHQLKAGDPAWLMGVINVTPDSFSDGGEYLSASAACLRGEELADAGAQILDIGGESTRPGAMSVEAEEEIRRTSAVIGALRKEFPDQLISIDTTKSEVAKVALEEGADIINDISGFTRDPVMFDLAARYDCGLVMMHMQGRPETMQNKPLYEDVVAEVRAFFEDRVAQAGLHGVDLKRICFDPGIGFGKTHGHNLALLNSLDELAPEGFLLLLGVSRKSVIGRCLGDMNMALRDWPTVALTAWARRLGTLIHRVHNVEECWQALRMTEALIAAEKAVANAGSQ